MNEFIESHNVAVYEHRLRIEIDPIRRKTLLKLLANEKAKLKTTLFNNRESKRLFGTQEQASTVMSERNASIVSAARRKASH